MSIQTWITEFGIKTDLEKWEGMTPENLAKHNVSITHNRNLSDGESEFPIDSYTCQLCSDNLTDVEGTDGYFVDSCGDCPLFISRGCPCSEQTNEEVNNSEHSPFMAWQYNSNPEPMIAALQKIKDKLPQRGAGVNIIEEIKKEGT